MHNLIYALPALACPIGMIAMMWFMGRGSREKRAEPAGQSTLRSVEQLREEHARIAAELERIERQPTSSR